MIPNGNHTEDDVTGVLHVGGDDPLTIPAFMGLISCSPRRWR